MWRISVGSVTRVVHFHETDCSGDLYWAVSPPPFHPPISAPLKLIRSSSAKFPFLTVESLKKNNSVHTKMNMAQAAMQEDVLRNTAEAMVVPLKDAVCSLNEVYQALIEADVDPVTGQCSNYDYIRQQIVEAHQHLQQSERAASSELGSLDRNLESLIEDEGKLEREMNETKQTLDNLRTEQTSNKELLRNADGAVKLARENLDSAKQTLQDQENRKHRAEVVTGVGVGLLVIPVIGWIAGSATIIAGVVELNAADQAVHVAEDEVGKSENELKKYKQKVSDYESEISQTDGDISQKDEQLRQTRKEIQRVRRQMEAVGEFQMKLRSAVNFLDGLSGKVRVVELQTRRFILQEPVMKVMEDVMNAMKKITGNELLYSEDMSRLIQKIKENERCLKAVCVSESSC